MSKKGKKARLAEEQNKEDENTQIHKEPKMSPSSTYICELIIGENSAQDGDALGYFTAVEEGETIPTATMGCYIPINRPNMSQRLDALEQENVIIKAFLENFVKSHFDKFRNLVVQLGNAVQEVVVLRIFPEARKRFGAKHLTFDAILYSENVTQDELRRFLNNDLFKLVSALTIRNSDFRDVRFTWNRDTHPEIIDMHDLETVANELGNGELLGSAERALLLKTKSVFSKLLTLNGLQELVREYNNGNFK